MPLLLSEDLLQIVGFSEPGGGYWDLGLLYPETPKRLF